MTMVTEIPCYIEETGVTQLERYCEERSIHRFWLVADENTYAALGRAVETALAARGWAVKSIVLEGPEVIADEHAITQVLLQIDGEPRHFLAVGSGTVTDITRFVSHRTRSPFIAMPTAPSVDGYTSTGAPLVIGRYKWTFQAHPPLAVFADLPTLCAAPRLMIAAGFGDMLGKFTALADWRLDHLLWDGPYDAAVAQRTRAALQHCVDHAAEIGQASAAGIRALMEGLIESGLCMTTAGHSRPASGAEHLLAHYWEMLLLREGRPAILHGAKVGVGAVLIAGYYAQLRKFTPAEALARLQATPWPDPEAEMERLRMEYGELARAIIDEQRRFLALTASSRDRLIEKIVGHWPEIQAIAATVPAPDTLRAWLAQVGGPADPADLGLSDDEGGAALAFAHYLRDRFTVYKLSRMLGMAD